MTIYASSPWRGTAENAYPWPTELHTDQVTRSRIGFKGTDEQPKEMGRVQIEILSAWRKTFNADWKSAEVPGEFPVCLHSTLHRWYLTKGNNAKTLRGQSSIGQGRLWEWCSTCRTYAHYPDGLVPDWWIPPYDVDVNHLQYSPAPIEEARTSST